MLLEEMYFNIDLDEIPKYTKVVGVSFYDRQETIKTLSINQKLKLIRDYKNEHDRNAVGVYANKKLVGWISRNISQKLAPEIDNGLHWEAIITDITGEDKETRGINIRLVFIDK